MTSLNPSTHDEPGGDSDPPKVDGKLFHLRRPRSDGDPRPAAEEPTRFLVDKARRGDDQAWREIGDRYRAALMLLMRNRIPADARRRFDSDDVYQSTMFRAYKEIHSYEYEGPGSFYGWLVRIFKRRIVSKLREHRADKRDHRRDQHLSSVKIIESGDSSGGAPELLVGDAELYARLVEGFSLVDKEHQFVIATAMSDSFSMTALARELDVSRRTAGRRLAEAFEALHKVLEDMPPDPGGPAFPPEAFEGEA